MTTSPDTVHAAETTTEAEATRADRATPASAGTNGGTVNATARTQPRTARPDLAGRADLGVPALPGRRVRGRPARGAGRRHPAAVGLGPGLARRADRAGLLLGVRSRRHGRLPPVLHARLLQGEDRPAGRAGRSRAASPSRGPVITWVSDHRRHHKYSDKEGDPHSPWRYGDDWKALSKGLVYAHIGWLFDPNKTSQEKFSPDLLADRRIRAVDALVPGARRGLAAAPRRLSAACGGCPGKAR